MPFSVSTLRQLNRVMTPSEKLDLVRMMISTADEGKIMIALIAAEAPIYAHAVGLYQHEARSMFDDADANPLGRGLFSQEGCLK